jgi:hypothetical protein
MKHRSVIAFVIVAAALFAAPQLSHDLQNFKSALGSRLRGELMHAFLSLPTGEGTPAAVAQRPAETLFASCTKQKPSAKPRKNDTAAPSRAEVRTTEQAGDELASNVEALHASEPWASALAEGSLVGAAALPRGPAGEVAMIIPPDSGVDPNGRARASRVAAREGERQALRVAEDVRVRFVAAGFDGKVAEWRKADEALRRLEEAAPGAYEFRLERDGSKTKVLKFKRVAAPRAPRPAPRAPRAAGGDAPVAPAAMPAVGVLSTFVGE